MNNKIILLDENGYEEIVSQIDGLNIKFKGRNSVVSIEKGSIFQSSSIILLNNCQVNIKRTDEYGIRKLSAELYNNCKLRIGNNFLCVSLRISANDEENSNVFIGNNCMFASNVIIRPSDGHSIYDINTGELLNKGENIVIGNHVWIGLNAIFLKGSKVADNSIIGANSLINKKFQEENVIIAGSPAKIIKRGVNWDRKSPLLYDNPIKIGKTEGDYKFSNGNSPVGTGLVYRKMKFDKILSFAYVFKKEKMNFKNIYKIIRAKALIKSLNLFDEEHYLIENRDVKNSNMDPLDHYIYHGWIEGRTPCKKFDGNYYLKKYPDVKGSKINPLVHYVLDGKKEGRFPNRHAELNLT
jgi:acetyltransferase-like isoleucine patch superfamily enzyme